MCLLCNKNSEKLLNQKMMYPYFNWYCKSLNSVSNSFLIWIWIYFKDVWTCLPGMLFCLLGQMYEMCYFPPGERAGWLQIRVLCASLPILAFHFLPIQAFEPLWRKKCEVWYLCYDCCILAGFNMRSEKITLFHSSSLFTWDLNDMHPVCVNLCLFICFHL